MMIRKLYARCSVQVSAALADRLFDIGADHKDLPSLQWTKPIAIALFVTT
jgi:hypothetical protein